MIRQNLIVTTVFLAVAGAAGAEEMDHSQHGGQPMNEQMEHKPGATAHTHHGHGAGSWMLSYQYMNMSMDGLMDGTSDLATSDVVMSGGGAYMMAPTKMTMDMHMLMGMYGFSDKVSMMVMANYLGKDMDMEASDGTPSSMSSSGVGDTMLGLMLRSSPNLVFSAGLSIPTGSIDEKGDMAMSAMMTMTNVQLPYAMQLGSGTYDVTPAMTWSGRLGAWSGSMQAAYTWRTGSNDNEYTLGNRLELDFSGKWAMTPAFFGTGRLKFSDWGNVSGADPTIAQSMMGNLTSPAADPNAQGGSRADLMLGINGRFGGHGLGLEVGVPVYQNLDGPQMKTDMVIIVGYQFMMM